MEKDFFIIHPTTEEQNEFVITIGKHLATEKRFPTRQAAEKYKSRPRWDMILALVAEMQEVNEELKNNKTENK